MITLITAVPSLTLVWACLFTLALIQTKHLIIDWIWQPPYEHQNKGTYGHFGGIRHAGKNAIGTGIALWIGLSLVLPLTLPMVLGLTVLDFVVHYHIDWCKVNLNRFWGLGPLTHCEFWWLTGFDQYLHQMTYLTLIVLAIWGCL